MPQRTTKSKERDMGKNLVAHNGIAFDFPVLNRVGSKDKTISGLDTLVLSRLLKTKRTKHSLAAWGEDSGFHKTDSTGSINTQKR